MHELMIEMANDKSTDCRRRERTLAVVGAIVTR